MKTYEGDWARTWKLGAGDDMRTPSQWMLRALELEKQLAALKQALGSMEDAGEVIRRCQLIVSEERGF